MGAGTGVNWLRRLCQHIIFLLFPQMSSCHLDFRCTSIHPDQCLYTEQAERMNQRSQNREKRGLGYKHLQQDHAINYFIVVIRLTLKCALKYLCF